MRGSNNTLPRSYQDSRLTRCAPRGLTIRYLASSYVSYAPVASLTACLCSDSTLALSASSLLVHTHVARLAPVRADGVPYQYIMRAPEATASSCESASAA